MKSYEGSTSRRDVALYRAVCEQSRRNELANRFWLDAGYPTERIAQMLLDRQGRAAYLREASSDGVIPSDVARAWRCLLTIALQEARGRSREAALALGAAIEDCDGSDAGPLGRVTRRVVSIARLYGVKLADIDNCASVGAVPADTFHADIFNAEEVS